MGLNFASMLADADTQLHSAVTMPRQHTTKVLDTNNQHMIQDDHCSCSHWAMSNVGGQMRPYLMGEKGGHGNSSFP